MAQTAYTGIQGSGKSFEVVRNVILPNVAKGRRVVTNVAGLKIDLINQYCVDKLGADPNKLGEIVQVENERIEQPDFFPVEITENVVSTWFKSWAKACGVDLASMSEEEKRQEVEQQMQALSGGPSTPIEQVTELGEGIIQKLVTAGITTVEALADMTPEQLEEIPGIGEKTLERISVAVRHYFGHFEEGEEGHVPEAAEEEESAETEEASGVEGEEPAVSDEDREAVLSTDDAEAENSAATIKEAEEEGHSDCE